MCLKNVAVLVCRFLPITCPYWCITLSNVIWGYKCAGDTLIPLYDYSVSLLAYIMKIQVSGLFDTNRQEVHCNLVLCGPRGVAWVGARFNWESGDRCQNTIQNVVYSKWIQWLNPFKTISSVSEVSFDNRHESSSVRCALSGCANGHYVINQERWLNLRNMLNW